VSIGIKHVNYYGGICGNFECGQTIEGRNENEKSHPCCSPLLSCPTVPINKSVIHPMGMMSLCNGHELFIPSAWARLPVLPSSPRPSSLRVMVMRHSSRRPNALFRGEIQINEKVFSLLVSLMGPFRVSCKNLGNVGGERLIGTELGSSCSRIIPFRFPLLFTSRFILPLAVAAALVIRGSKPRQRPERVSLCPIRKP